MSCTLLSALRDQISAKGQSMKMLSCHKYLAANDQTNGGVGQGGGSWWTDVAGIKLQQAIADELGAELVLSPRLHGSNSYNGGDYDVPAGTADVAYVQLFESPRRRPADFVWSVISDYIGMQEHLERWLDETRPDLLISFQYPLDPPPMIGTVPNLDILPNLVEQCANYGCRVAFTPWFNEVNQNIFNPNKTWTAMCSGKMSGTYPWRNAVYEYLKGLNRPDIVLSGNPHGSTFKLSDEEYRNALASTKYYFSGGIYDLQIPPKYFEIANHGACLVTNDMPMLADCGFVHGETCLIIKSLDEIPYLLQSDLWYLIAKAGQKLVHERHSMTQRAKDIAKLIREMTGEKE